MDSLTPTQAASKGFSRSAFYRAIADGEYERIARGIYVETDGPAADWNMVEAATRRVDATICLISALSLHDLTDEIPAALDVAIPRGTRIPAGQGNITWHSFDRPSFTLGRQPITIPGASQQIGLYSAERSIVDAFRLRDKVGYETARDALKEWLRRGGKPAELIEMAAQIPRAKAPILHALEVLT